MKAVLVPAVFLNWCSAYDYQVELHAHINIQYNLPIPHDMLMGNGQPHYSGPNWIASFLSIGL